MDKQFLLKGFLALIALAVLSYSFGAMVVLVFVVVLASGLGVLLLVRKKYQRYMTAMYSIRDDRGIEVLEPVMIGGLKQWLHIRGRNKDNPILLFIHGGPGFTHIGWFDEIQKPWENHFTVVQWDQRQVGKSYAPLRTVGKTVNHQQMIADTEEVVAYLRKRFQQNKIFIMGTSYGTYLGMHIAKRQPDWLYAYISIGQVVTMMEHAKDEHKRLLNHAQDTGDKEAIATLDGMQPFPDPDNKAASFFRYVGFMIDREFTLGKCYPMSLSEIMAMVWVKQLLSPHYSLKDIWHKIFGDPSAIQSPSYGFAEEFMHYDLPNEVGYQFDTPIVFLTGANDWHVSAEISDQYFQRIESPYKEQVWFDQSAHMAFVTEPTAFSRALIERVLPLSLNQDAEP